MPHWRSHPKIERVTWCQLFVVSCTESASKRLRHPTRTAASQRHQKRGKLWGFIPYFYSLLETGLHALHVLEVRTGWHCTRSAACGMAFRGGSWGHRHSQPSLPCAPPRQCHHHADATTATHGTSLRALRVAPWRGPFLPALDAVFFYEFGGV